MRPPPLGTVKSDVNPPALIWPFKTQLKEGFAAPVTGSKSSSELTVWLAAVEFVFHPWPVISMAGENCCVPTVAAVVLVSVKPAADVVPMAVCVRTSLVVTVGVVNAGLVSVLFVIVCADVRLTSVSVAAGILTVTVPKAPVTGSRVSNPDVAFPIVTDPSVPDLPS